MRSLRETEAIASAEASRERTIVRTSVVGIAANVLLAAFKAAVGLMANSIAIVLDAVNNLSDAGSSLITIVGTRLAGRAPDKKHPFGYGRIEYLSAMIIAVIVLYAGVTSLVESVKQIVRPETPEYGTVSAFFPQNADVLHHFLFTHFMQNVLSEIFCHGTHLCRYRRIVRCQIRMRSLGIGDTQMISPGCKIIIQFFKLRFFRICKIDMHQTADRAGHLIHQSAGFSEIDILRILSDLCDLYRRNRTVIIEIGKNITKQGFKCRRGRKPRTDQHIAGHISLETADLKSPFLHPRCNTADQGCGRILLFFLYGKICSIDLQQRIFPRHQRDPVILRCGYDRDRIFVDRSRQHFTMLMIRVIASDLRTPRRGKDRKILQAELFFKRLYCLLITVFLKIRLAKIEIMKEGLKSVLLYVVT